MSKTISIQEWNTTKQFTVDKLKTNLVGGETCTWVPEDETQTAEKHITENGTYYAATDDVYAYDVVYVNVPGGNGSANDDGTPNTDDGNAPGGPGSAVVGTNPDTGDEEVVGINEDGEIVTTPVPSAIQIVKPPDKTTQVVGHAIDFTGIDVILKTQTGNTFTNGTYTTGHIPFSELIFPTPIPEQAGTYTVPVSWRCPYTGRTFTDTFQLIEQDMYILITTPPTKLVYNDGDTIDFTGMVVTCYNADDTPWTDGGTYPNGVIPHSDLTFPVTIASFDGDDDDDDDELEANGEGYGGVSGGGGAGRN